jgi:hypothetical protein
MTTLEIAVLVVFGLILLGINSLASLRCLRTLGRYGLPYLALAWFVPFIGAVYVLAKIRPKQNSAFIPISTNTVGLDNNPTTLQGDPWPTLSQPIPPQRHPRKK